jgi:hypothetical protein
MDTLVDKSGKILVCLHGPVYNEILEMDIFSQPQAIGII